VLVQQIVNSDRQVINFELGHQRSARAGEAEARPSHLFEAQSFDGKTIASRRHERAAAILR
jgi:hypothetical protein